MRIVPDSADGERCTSDAALMQGWTTPHDGRCEHIQRAGAGFPALDVLAVSIPKVPSTQ